MLLCFCLSSYFLCNHVTVFLPTVCVTMLLCFCLSYYRLCNHLTVSLPTVCVTMWLSRLLLSATWDTSKAAHTLWENSIKTLETQLYCTQRTNRGGYENMRCLNRQPKVSSQFSSFLLLSIVTKAAGHYVNHCPSLAPNTYHMHFIYQIYTFTFVLNSSSVIDKYIYGYHSLWHDYNKP